METLTFFYIVIGVLQGDTLAAYLLILCIDYKLEIYPGI